MSTNAEEWRTELLAAVAMLRDRYGDGAMLVRAMKPGPTMFPGAMLAVIAGIARHAEAKGTQAEQVLTAWTDRVQRARGGSARRKRARAAVRRAVALVRAELANNREAPALTGDPKMDRALLASLCFIGEDMAKAAVDAIRAREDPQMSLDRYWDKLVQAIVKLDLDEP